MPETPSHTPARGRGVLRLIAAFKFVKAAALILAGAGAIGLLSPRIADRASGLLERLALGGPHPIARLAGRALPMLDAAGPHKLLLIALGAFLYAAVFVTEGVGLMRERRWAEYLTIAVTVSFLPFEAVAVARRASPERVVALVLNVAVVVYLVWRVLGDRAARRAEGHARAA